MKKATKADTILNVCAILNAQLKNRRKVGAMLKRRAIKAGDKVSRKEIMRLLKKDRLKASKKAIVINGQIYVNDDYVRQMIKSIKEDEK